jgi:site-specific recombinase XerD
MERELISEEEKEFFFKGLVLPKVYVEYRQYLIHDKGMAVGTIHNRKKPVLRLMIDLPQFSSYSHLIKVQPDDIHKYVIKRSQTLTRYNKKKLVEGLRDFFRFLHLKGHIKKDLSVSIPTVINYRLSTINRGIPWSVVQKLIAIPDRRTHTGRRDYAIVLTFARYGIRGKQLVNFKLSDIDWKNKKVHFPAMKGGKAVDAPLLPDVAQALIAYFKGGRMSAPKKYKEVFLTIGRGGSVLDGQRPLGPKAWYIVSRNLKKVDFDRSDLHTQGPHSIRHAFATKLLEEKMPMKSISDLLGHKSLSTTFVYAKSDLKRLRELVVPWPKGFIYE